MRLYANAASPFARKARVIAYELGLKLELINTSPLQDENFRQVNPLGKIPALVLDDGSLLIDSRVICEYLNALGGGKFFPGATIWRSSSGRWRALGLAALGDGLADAAVAWIILGRETPVAESARRRQMQAIVSTLDRLERTKFLDPPTIGEISVACALGYLEFRLVDMNWKSSHPRLHAWYCKFCDFAAMKATAPSVSL